MIAVSVREMKAHWSEIEKKIQQGETFTILNRGKPTARIVPAKPEKVLVWPRHLETALPNSGRSGSDTVLEDRGDR